MKHARYYWLLLAESHLTRRLFGAILGRIELLSMPAGLGPFSAPRNSQGPRQGDGEVSEKSRRQPVQCAA